MLASKKIVAFVPTTDYANAKSFYADVLGLTLISEDPFAMVFDANGIMLRVVKAGKFTPQQFTVLGWEVTDIDTIVLGLAKNGVTFEKYGMPGQDERGIWSAPGGAKVAWFKDPDGNVLSVSQHS
ncbi:MAG TPA: VOC family protein [Terriglobales bacterium]|jgi:predicted enzyme related to lactoylglutathione lyase